MGSEPYTTSGGVVSGPNASGPVEATPEAPSSTMLSTSSQIFSSAPTVLKSCLAPRRHINENNSGGLLMGVGVPFGSENGIDGVFMVSVTDVEKRVRSPSVQRKDEQRLCDLRAKKVIRQCTEKGCNP